MELNVLQRYGLRRISKYKDSIICHSRQVGVDTMLAWLCVKYMMAESDMTIGYIGRDIKSGTYFIKRINTIIEQENISQITFRNKQLSRLVTFNNVNVIATSISHANPTAIFRGNTINILIVNDAAFIRENLFTQGFAAVAPSLSISRARSDKPSKIILASTLNSSKDNWFNNLWEDSFLGKTQYKPIFMHYDYLDDGYVDTESVRNLIGDESFKYEMECLAH